MRVVSQFLIPVAFCATASALRAQDAGALAAQQAMQTTTQIATQQTIAAQQQAALNQQIAQQNVQLAIDAANGPYSPAVRRPKIEVTDGPAPGTLGVQLKAHGRAQKVFYSIGVWSPTRRSTPYDSPVTLEPGQTLIAVAYAPDGRHSDFIAVTAPGKPILRNAVAVARDGSATDLRAVAAGTPLTLAFRDEVTSQTLAVGDTLPVELASDWVVNGVRLAPKGTPARVTVTQVVAARRAGQGGLLGFAARSITVQGVTIPLEGEQAMEAGPISDGTRAGALMPVVGPAFLLKHGRQAVIPKGSTFEATVEEPRAAAMRASAEQ
jgi:hypothetical protein